MHHEVSHKERCEAQGCSDGDPLPVILLHDRCTQSWKFATQNTEPSLSAFFLKLLWTTEQRSPVYLYKLWHFYSRSSIIGAAVSRYLSTPPQTLVLNKHKVRCDDETVCECNQYQLASFGLIPETWPRYYFALCYVQMPTPSQLRLNIYLNGGSHNCVYSSAFEDNQLRITKVFRFGEHCNCHFQGEYVLGEWVWSIIETRQ